MISERCKLIIIRHSERVDDVDELAWKKLVVENKSKGGRKCFINDPVISSKDGVAIAGQMAQSVEAIIRNNHSGAVVHLYASRLLRATQTASFVGRILNVPVRVSGGLAQIIPAARNNKEGYQFASISELTQYCPSVRFIDCDDERSLENYLPTHSWRAAVDTLLANSDGKNVINIVVAHRETVRKLAGEYLETPYCCMGMFSVAYTTNPEGVCNSGNSNEEIDEYIANTTQEDSKANEKVSIREKAAVRAKEKQPDSTSHAAPSVRNKVSATSESKMAPVRKVSSSVYTRTIPAALQDTRNPALSLKGKIDSSGCKLVADNRVTRTSKALSPSYQYVYSVIFFIELRWYCIVPKRLLNKVFLGFACAIIQTLQTLKLF